METSTQKEIGVVAASVLISIITFFALALVATQSPSGWLVTLAVLLGIVWLVGTTISLAFTTHATGVGIIILGGTAATLFAGAGEAGAIAAAAILAIFMILARHAFRVEARERLDPSSYRAFVPGLKLLATGLLLAVAGLALAPTEASLTNSGLQLEERHVEKVIAPIEPVLNNLVPGLSVDSTTSIDDLIASEIERQLPGTEVTDELIEQIKAEQFGDSELPTSESLTTVTTRFVNDYLDRTVRGQELIVALILIVVVLLTIRALIPLLAWIIVLLVKPTIWGSERAGLLRRTEEPTVIERLTL